jgi:hypothetical protein
MPVIEGWKCYVPGDLNPHLVGLSSSDVMSNPHGAELRHESGNPLAMFSQAGRELLSPDVLSDAQKKATIAVVMGGYKLTGPAAASINMNLKPASSTEPHNAQMLYVRVPEIHSYIPDPFCEDNVYTKEQIDALVEMHTLVSVPLWVQSSPRIFHGSLIEIEFGKSWKEGEVTKILSEEANRPTMEQIMAASQQFAGTGQPWPFNGPIKTPDEIKECADEYDEAVGNNEVYTKWQKSPWRHYLLDGLHPEFLPYVKCLFHRIYTELEIECRIWSTHRSVETQQRLYLAYKDCLAKGGKSGVDCIPAGKPAGPTATGHNAGMAIDCTLRYTNGKKFSNGTDRVGGLEPFDVWESTGVPRLVRSNSMGYGGDWKSCYDPVHWHASKDILRHTTTEIRQRVADEGIPANRLSNVMKTTAPPPEEES